MAGNLKAVITGGSRGIGFAVADELMELGYELVLVANSAERLRTACARLVEKHPNKPAPHMEAADFADEEALGGIIESISASNERIDLLFNGAGISVPGTFQLSGEELDRIFAINVRAPFLFMKSIMPMMAKRGGGRVINMASRNGLVAVSGLGGYSASKFALMGLGEAAFREYSRVGVSITTICPGWVNTDMAAAEGASLPPGDMIQPRDIALTVRWLLSLSRPVRIINVLMECAGDVESRASVELAKLRALRASHPDEFAAINPW